MGAGHSQITQVLKYSTTLYYTAISLDAPRYSEELKESLAEQVFGTKLILGEENEFNAELVYRTACKVGVLIISNITNAYLLTHALSLNFISQACFGKIL